MTVCIQRFSVRRFVILAAAALCCLGASSQDEGRIPEVRHDRSPLDRSLNGGVVSYAESLRLARPAVVSVYSNVELSEEGEVQGLLERFFGDESQAPRYLRYGLGSGVIVSEDGYILTNNHVIEKASTITVTLDDQKSYEAELIGADPRTDIAVIKIEAEGLATLAFADSEQIEVGDVVFAIGNPLGIGKTVTMGIVSATRRQQMGVIAGGFEDFIQTDASINTGNSGGALVDAQGRLIGINTLIQTDGASSGNIGIGFAVPINMAHSVMIDLVTTGTVARGFLGVGIGPMTQELADHFELSNLRGALVNFVGKDTPAQTVGLQPGDLILEVDGKSIESPSDLRLTIAARKPDEIVSLHVIRDGEPLNFEVTLTRRQDPEVSRSELPEEFEFDPLRFPGILPGVELGSLNEQSRSEYGFDESLEGVLVEQVNQASRFSDSLSKGMVILKVNGEYVREPSDVYLKLKVSSSNELLVFSAGAYRRVTIDL